MRTAPACKVQITVSALLVGVINEIVLPDLDRLPQDNPVALVRKFLDSVGIQLCPTGTAAVADPDVDFVSCVSL